VDTLEHGTFIDEECVDEMAKRGTTFVPTLAIMNDNIARGASWGYSTEQLDAYRGLLRTRYRAVKIAYDSGVPIGLGTDSSGWLAPHGLNGVEFSLLREAGLSTIDCIRAGTQVAASALGLGRQIGTVEVGKEADLVVLDANPLEDLTTLGQPAHVRAVIRSGQVVVEWSGGGPQVQWAEDYGVSETV
jgi:imidazolonepropionase-like amidohydrolase